MRRRAAGVAIVIVVDGAAHPFGILVRRDAIPPVPFTVVRHGSAVVEHEVTGRLPG
jgi:hypothetical protein